MVLFPLGLFNKTCLFYISATYPADVPTIIVRSSILTQEQKLELTSALELVALAKSGRSDKCLSFIVEFSVLWLDENEINATISQKSTKNKSKAQSKPKSKKKPVDESVNEFVKKPSMKTAADVIKRLQWDEFVQKEDFIVGYMDRIVGLVEKRFTAFTWEDLASVDYMSLAIPQHRIQYFKYKSEKVWDKNERLDNVFGSAGNKLTLTEAIEIYEAKELELEKSKNKEIEATVESGDSISSVTNAENSINDEDIIETAPSVSNVETACKKVEDISIPIDDQKQENQEV